MARRVSPKPTQFNQRHEEQYWHEAQDVAFLAGASLVERAGCTWLLFDDREQLICQPQDPSRIWFETWAKLKAEYPLLTRLWVDGRALTKPGEMEHRKSKDHS